MTGTNLTVWIDDERVIQVVTEGKKIAMRPGEIEMSAPFGVATWSTTAELRNVRWRSLGEDPKPGAGAGAFVLPERLAEAADRIVSKATNSHRRAAPRGDVRPVRAASCRSTNLEMAIDWILSQMKQDGLDAVRGSRWP